MAIMKTNWLRGGLRERLMELAELLYAAVLALGQDCSA
jgi:hypothetical protein